MIQILIYFTQSYRMASTKVFILFKQQKSFFYGFRFSVSIINPALDDLECGVQAIWSLTALVTMHLTTATSFLFYYHRSKKRFMGSKPHV